MKQQQSTKIQRDTMNGKRSCRQNSDFIHSNRKKSLQRTNAKCCWRDTLTHREREWKNKAVISNLIENSLDERWSFSTCFINADFSLSLPPLFACMHVFAVFLLLPSFFCAFFSFDVVCCCHFRVSPDDIVVLFVAVCH